VARCLGAGLHFAELRNNHLDAVEQVLRWARRRGHIDRKHAPVRELRQDLREDAKTKAGRAAIDRKRRLAKDGVLSPAEVGRPIAAAEAEGLEALILVGLALESGRRRAEIRALRHCNVALGGDEDDVIRRLIVNASQVRPYPREEAKSGRQREPHISRRLRAALLGLGGRRMGPRTKTRNVLALVSSPPEELNPDTPGPRDRPTWRSTSRPTGHPYRSVRARRRWICLRVSARPAR